MTDSAADSKHDEQRMLYQAVAFYEAALRCEREQPLVTVPHVMPLDIPMIVCHAFSIEVYFKALGAKVRRSDGHHLGKLFAAIDPGVRSQILASYSALGKPAACFEERLVNLARAFEDWRYLYEKDSLDACTSDLQEINRAVHDAADILKPHLRKWPV